MEKVTHFLHATPLINKPLLSPSPEDQYQVVDGETAACSSGVGVDGGTCGCTRWRCGDVETHVETHVENKSLD